MEKRETEVISQVILQVIGIPWGKKSQILQTCSWRKLLKSEWSDWLEHVWTLGETTEKEGFPTNEVLVAGKFLSIRHWEKIKRACYSLPDTTVYKSSK